MRPKTALLAHIKGAILSKKIVEVVRRRVMPAL
jgi:hypothetical protein